MAKRVWTTAVTSCVAVAAVLLATAPRIQAQFVASDRTAGYIVFPDVELDRTDQFNQGRRVDTVFQLTNTATTGCRTVHCAYVNATKHCANEPARACRTNADCLLGGTCGIFAGSNADCKEALDFVISLSAGQAIGWTAGEGGFVPPDVDNCGPAIGQPILALQDDVVVGELKCVELSSPDGTPINSNDLKGEATIYAVQSGVPGGIDVRTYNAVGFPALATDGAAQPRRCVGGASQGSVCAAPADCPSTPSSPGTCSSVLCLGSTTSGSPPGPAPGAVCGTATHAACPSALVLNHWFDFAPNPVTSLPMFTNLTLVPCSQNLAEQGPALSPATVVQLLIYNEFEQRFSASTSVACFRKTQLSQIDARVGAEIFSLFSVYVQGTLTGQTRIRPVTGNELDKGHGVIGVMEEVSGASVPQFPFGSSAANLGFTMPISGKADVVTLVP
jgi:hypothetical protein